MYKQLLLILIPIFFFTSCPSEKILISNIDEQLLGLWKADFFDDNTMKTGAYTQTLNFGINKSIILTKTYEIDQTKNSEINGLYEIYVNKNLNKNFRGLLIFSIDIDNDNKNEKHYYFSFIEAQLQLISEYDSNIANQYTKQ